MDRNPKTWQTFYNQSTPGPGRNKVTKLTIFQPSHKVKDQTMGDARCFFDLNGNDYKFYNSPDTPPNNLDILVFDDLNKNLSFNHESKIKLYLNLFINAENQVNVFFNYINNLKHTSPAYFITICEDHTVSNPNILYTDFLFNLTKAYYSQYPFSVDTAKWHFISHLAYSVPDHIGTKQKIFVAPNRTYLKTNRKIKFRPRLVEFLKNYSNIGYLSDGSDTPGLNLYSHLNLPWCEDIHLLESGVEFDHYPRPGYSPPHSEYYKNTFISIFCETIEFGTSIGATEKTYDPLIKGHFVLPFSTSNFIKHLKNKGFRFPDFIDYSYDSIVDDELRYSAFQKEVQRLLDIDIDTWRQYWFDNLDLIRHNQLVFHETPYYRIDIQNLINR